MQEQEKYLAGVQYRIDEFRASVENLANTFMSADFLKNAIKTGTAFVNVLEKIIDNFGTIAALAGTVATALGSKWNIFGKMFEINNVKKSNLPWIQSMTAGDIAGMGNLRSAKMLIDEYNTSFLNLERTTKNTGLTHSQFISEISEGQPILAAELQKLGPDTAYTMRQYVGAFTKATIKTAALKAGTMLLQGALIALASYIVTKVVQGIDELIVTQKEAIEMGEQAQQRINEVTDAFKNQQSVISNSAKRFAELSQGVDQLTGKNLSLSDEEYKEFLDISNELADVFPTLSYHYDENGNKIVELNGDVETIVGSLESLLKVEQELARQKILEDMDDVFKGAKASANEATKSIENLEKKLEILKSQQEAVQSDLESGFISTNLANQKNVKTILDRYGLTYQTQAMAYGDTIKFLIDEDKLTDSIKGQIVDSFNNAVVDAEKELEDAKKNRAQGMSGTLAQGIFSLLFSDYNFAMLSDEMQTYVQQIVNNVDWSAMDFKNWDDLKAFLSNDFLSKIKDNVGDFQLLFGLGTQFNSSEITWDEYKEKLAALLPIINMFDDNTKKALEVVLGVNFVYDEEGQVTGATNQIVDVFKNQLVDAGIDDEIANTIASGLTDAELKAAQESDLDWNEIIGTADAKEALGEVRKSLLQVINTPFEIEFNEDAIEEAQGGMKRLQEVYEDLVNANKKGKSGADLASSFTELNKLLEESSKNANDAIKVSDATWQEFFNTMTDGQHTFEEMEAALNKVVTEYVTGTIDIQNFDEAMAKTMSTQLQKFGATKESADAYVATMTDVANTLKQAQDEGHNLISVLDDEAIAWINSADMSDKAREQLALVVLQKQLVNGLTINTEGDIKNLQQLMAWAGVTSDKLLKVFQMKQLLNGVISNEQRGYIESKIDELENEGEEELNAAISEKMKQYMSLKQDVNKIKDSSKSGGSGSSKDTWKEAYEKELSELDKLHEMELISDIKYYEKREELNDKYFKGQEKYVEEYNKNVSEIYKGFQSTYKQFVDDMFSYGEKAFDLTAVYKTKLKWRELLNVDEYEKAVDEMKEYQKQGNVDLFNRKLISGNTMIAAGWTTEKYGMDAESIATVFTSAFDIVNSKGEKVIAHVTPILPDGTVLSPEELEDYVYGVLNGTNNILAADSKGIVLKVDENVAVDALGNVTEEAWAAADAWDEALHNVQDIVLIEGEKTGAKFVSMIDKYTNKAGQTGVVNLQEYIGIMKQMLDYLFGQNKINAETYYSDLENLYGYEISQMDKATNAAQRVIKKRIEAFEKEKKALEKNYEAQEKAIQTQIDGINEVIDGKNAQIKAINKQIDAINDEIDVYQKEIDKINEANEERQAALDMQKALYELNRAEQQRQNYVYNSEKGFVYEADAQAIKDAQDEINNLEHEQVIRGLEKTISTLQDSIEVLEDDIENIEDEIEVLEEQIDAFEKQIESLEKELEVLVEKIEVQIDSLEEYSDAIGDCANKWTEAQEDMAAASLWGADWQEKILSESQKLVQDFESMYVQAQKNQAQAALDAAAEKVRAYNKEIEAINALKEAEQNAEKTSGVSQIDTTAKVSGKTTDKDKDTATKSNIADRVNAQMAEAARKKSTSTKSTKSSTRSVYVYGTGTDKAASGIHEIAESGDEIIVDNYGNAYLAKGRQLHRFEGGEKVYTPAETNELLNGKYIPIDSLIPNYTALLTKVMNGSVSPLMNMSSNILTKRGNTAPMQVDNSIHIEIGDISVTEVDNAAQIAKAIKNKLPNALLQELNRK